MSDKFQADFTGKVRESYQRNGGRLFLVDDAKFSALEAVNAILAEEAPSSILFLAEDAAVAAEISANLRKIPRDSVCITNAESLKRHLNLPSAGYKNYIARAATFKQEYPVVVLSATDEEGKIFLNRKLCDDPSDNGNYYSLDNKLAAFCVSDFFAACGYEFVAIDAVYTFLQFRVFAEGAEEPDPLLYDHLDFLGKSYFTDLGHSYKRLKDIAGAAKHCIAMSDTVFEQDVMELYAVLHLLGDSYSFVKQRSAIQKITDLYNDYCDRVYNDLSNCKMDVHVQDDCIHFAASGKQKTPQDIASMENYLVRKMKYTSEEEIFLQAIEAYVRLRLRGRQGSLEEIVDSMESEMEEMSQCFMGMYFTDTVKGELESALQHSVLHSMTAREIAAVLNVFKRYGVSRTNRIPPNEETVLRIYRDYSPFEYISRESFPAPIKGDLNYTVLRESPQDECKCLGIYQLLKENNAKNFRLPACVVVKDGMRKTVAELLGKYFAGKVHSFADFNGDGILVAEVSRMRKIAYKPQISTAVFYDILPDVFLFSRLVSKFKSMGDVRIIAMCDFTDMGGYLLNEWREILFSPQVGSIPFGLPAIERKSETFESYASVETLIASCYSMIVKSVEGGKVPVKEFSNEYLTLSAKLEDVTNVSASAVESDAKFFSDTAKNLGGVIGNSVSAGRVGESVEVHTYNKGQDTSTRAPYKLLFNVCSRELLRTCNVKINDCKDCARYEELHMNDFLLFGKNVNEYFEKVIAFVSWREETLQQKRSGETINFDGRENTEFETFKKNALEQKKNAESALSALFGSVTKKDGVAYVEYDDAVKVLDTLESVSNSVLSKYLSRLIEMFGNISGKLRTIYKTVCEGMTAAGNK